MIEDNKHTEGISDELRGLTRRVERLERSNWILKAVNLVALAVVVSITRIPSIWATITPSISAMRFNLVSLSGKTLATLGVNASGFPSLTFFDASGKRLTQVGEADNGKSAGLNGFDGNALLAGKGVPRAPLGINSAGAGEAEYDGNGIQRVGISINANSSLDGMFLLDAHKVVRATMLETAAPIFDGFSVALDDANGKVRSSMYVQNAISTTTYNGFALADPNGVGRASFSEPLSQTAPTGGPFLVLDDINGKARATLFAENAISSTTYTGFSLSDPNGVTKGLFFIPLEESSPTGGPGLLLNDVNGKSRATVGVNNSAGGARFSVFDANEIQRAVFGGSLNAGNGFIIFNNAADNRIGAWFPPAAPVP